MALTTEQIKKLEELGFEREWVPWEKQDRYKKIYWFDIYIIVLSDGQIYHNWIKACPEAQRDLAALKGVGL